MPLCIAAGGAATVLAVQAFTLAWTHSIEKTRWEEDWRVEAGAMRLTEARISGSGAGMEPPADARLAGGVWHYTPPLPPLTVLRLTQSPYAAGYTLCHDGNCAPLLGGLAVSVDGVIELSACAPSAKTVPPR